MLKILQARLQQYVNCELPNVQAGFRKGRGTRDQIVNIRWIIKKARKFQKNIYFCFIDYAKVFDCVDHNKLWKALKSPLDCKEIQPVHSEGDQPWDFFVKLVLEKTEEPEVKLSTSAGSSKKQESSRKTSISALLIKPKPLTVWITINCGKF